MICRNTPNLTEKQEEICIQVPESMVVMNQVMERFEDECRWQFKTSRWNCTNVTSPVYVSTALEGTYYTLDDVLTREHYTTMHARVNIKR